MLDIPEPVREFGGNHVWKHTKETNYHFRSNDISFETLFIGFQHVDHGCFRSLVQVETLRQIHKEHSEGDVLVTRSFRKSYLGAGS